MIFYLRDSVNCTIVDIEVYAKHPEDGLRDPYVEMGVSIDIKNYSKLLLYLQKRNATFVDKFVDLIDELSELRGWLWERYFMSLKNEAKHLDDVKAEVRKMLEKICQSWDFLYLVTG